MAPLLVEAGHTVVCPDLRGYGRSATPPPGPDYAAYSKRAMAADIVTLARRLGHERFDWWVRMPGPRGGGAVPVGPGAAAMARRPVSPPAR